MNYFNSISHTTMVISLLILFLIKNGNAQITGSQNYTEKSFKRIADTLIINECYEGSYETPIIVIKGDYVLNYSDSLHLVNNLRFHFYEKLRSIFNDSTDLNSDKLLLQYENLLNEYKLEYDNLLKNCDSSSKMFKKFISESDSTLKVTAQSLKLSNQSLSNVRLSLNEAQELLEYEKSAQLLEKISIGLGGVGLGILLSLLVQ